jgi:AAA+ ATPase superfamily predicted ATPase
MASKQEPILIPSFHLGQVVPTQYFVDRTDEIEYCENVLFKNRGNLLVLGKWRIGKTSLINKLIESIRAESKPKLLPVYINLAAYFDRNIDNFLEDLLIHICAGVGKVVFGKEYSEMLSEVGSGEGLFGADFKRLKRIFEMVRASQATRGRQTTSAVGIDSWVKGTREEGDTISFRVGGLFSYEFINLTKEIASICGAHGFERIVVFADEANKIAASKTSGIFGEYFQIFASEPLQFVFAAALQATSESPSIRDIFANELELDNFDSKDTLLELLRTYYSADFDLMYPEIPFGDDALERIWTLTDGHPYLIQLLCDRSLRVASAGKIQRVSEMDVLNSWVSELQRQPQITDIYKR